MNAAGVLYFCRAARVNIISFQPRVLPSPSQHLVASNRFNRSRNYANKIVFYRHGTRPRLNWPRHRRRYLAAEFNAVRGEQMQFL